MQRPALAGLAGLACLVACSMAGATSPPMPTSVAGALKPFVELCTEAGGQPSLSRAIRTANLNGDATLDYVVDVGAIDCAGAPGVYGDREKTVLVFAGDASGGAALAFQGLVYGVTLEPQGKSARVWLTVAGADCGKPPARDFASEQFCERPLEWNASTRKFEFAPLSAVKPIR